LNKIKSREALRFVFFA